MGVFIHVQVIESRMAPGHRQELVSLCPVDIFQLAGEKLMVETEQEDECTLCELCLDAAPAGAVTIRKTYKDKTLVSRGGGG